MIRTKVKGTRFKAASNPENEPDFYSMPYVMPMPSETSSDCDAPNVVSSSDSIVSMLPLQPKSFSVNHIVYGNSHHDTQANSSPLNPFLAAHSKNDSIISNPAAVKVETTYNVNSEEDLDDFSTDWSEALDNEFETILNDDVQLSYMLEKLLED